MFLAGLQGIPTQYYEAAQLDGAGKWQLFINITLPLLRSTTIFVIIVTTISSWQIFTPVYMLTQGGPANASSVLVFLVYQRGFEYFRMGEASTIAFILFVIILFFSLLQFRLSKKKTMEL